MENEAERTVPASAAPPPFFFSPNLFCLSLLPPPETNGCDNCNNQTMETDKVTDKAPERGTTGDDGPQPPSPARSGLSVLVERQPEQVQSTLGHQGLTGWGRPMSHPSHSCIHRSTSQCF